MLEQIRRDRRLGTTVLLLCVALWLVALWAGVRVRAMPGPAPMAAMAPASLAEAHGTGHTGGSHGSHNAQQTHDSHDRHSAAEPDAGSASEPAHEHGGHHGPDCVLCIALSPPASVAVLVYRPPVPRQGLGWHAPAQPPLSRLAAAPLPARGPPAVFHA
ncbi:hypothetical protein KW830_19535 [Comamonas sp. CMM03]|uniref:hypothetical protein n=1 Tax=Comamonas sp. CMM03 TaxID=2854781 RepID=UPI001C462439|nr:hypothetical protein [Comamonas sp. CMM03]MBV7420655.1 hypothetical protein [Comamonas sp. CMM03]